MKNILKGKNLIYVILIAVVVITATVTIAIKKPKENIEPEPSTTTTTTSTTLAEPAVEDVIPQIPADNSGIVVQQPEEEKTKEQKVEDVTVKKPVVPTKKVNNTTTTTTKKEPPAQKPTSPTQKVPKTQKVTTTTTKKQTSKLPREKDLDLTKLPNGYKYIDNQGYVQTILIENGKRYAVDEELGLRTVIPDNYSPAGPGEYKGCERCGKVNCGSAMKDWYCVICKKTIPAHECHDGDHYDASW